MKVKVAKKVGFFFALTMLIGSVVGIGIFFKNDSIAKANNHNGISWLLTWIISGLISLCCALSFSEISTIKNSKLTGLSNWASQMTSKKIGYTITFNYTFLYGTLLLCALSLFTAETLHYFINQCAGGSLDISPRYLPLSALLLFAFFFSLMMISLKNNEIIQKVGTIIKFIPLIMAILIGIILAKNNYNNTSSTDYKNAFKHQAINWDSFKGMIIALPGALFAYDAFLAVGSIGNNMEKAEKKMPFVVLIGMTTVIVTYCLIAISSVLHNAGVVQNIFDATLNKDGNSKLTKGISITFSLLLFVSAFSVLNGMTIAVSHDINNAINIALIPGANKLRNKYNLRKCVIIYVVSIYTIFWLFFSIIIWSTNSDITVDSVSNLPTLVFFNIYAFIIILYLKNRSKLETRKMNKIVFWIISIFAIIGSFGANLIYVTSLIESIVENENTSWGLFYDNNLKAPRYIELIIYLTYWLLFLILPIINYAIIKAVEKRNVIDEWDHLNDIDFNYVALFTNVKLNDKMNAKEYQDVLFEEYKIETNSTIEQKEKENQAN